MTYQLSKKRCVAIIMFLVSAPTVAMAYIDPGTGAYVVQAVFTVVGAAVFYLRHPSRLMNLVSRWWLSRRKALPPVSEE